jgi:hypothetical protein
MYRSVFARAERLRCSVRHLAASMILRPNPSIERALYIKFRLLLVVANIKRYCPEWYAGQTLSSLIVLFAAESTETTLPYVDWSPGPRPCYSECQTLQTGSGAVSHGLWV